MRKQISNNEYKIKPIKNYTYFTYYFIPFIIKINK